MPKSPTKRSTPKLSDVARHVVVPQGVATTGWPAVKAKAAELGVTFRWWQEPIGRIILGKRADGKYASTIGGTGLSIPRQVGKTFLVGMVVFALCLLRPKLTVVWSAHRVRTAEETFKKLQALTRRKRISPFVSRVILGSGEESIEFTNGSRILFGARAAGFGRGFDEVDVVVYDEAQILGDAALDDMIPATNQCRQPEGALMLFMGTPPKPNDPGEVFTRMRTEALSGEDTDTGWVEFGADEGYVPTSAPAALTDADWKQVAKANPSYPDDTPREAILRMRKKLGEDSFKREGLGIWDKVQQRKTVIDMTRWAELATATPPKDGKKAIGVKFSPDGAVVAIGAALHAEGEPIHVELAEYRSMTAGTGSLVASLAEIHKELTTIVVDGKAHASAFIQALRDEGVPASAITVPTVDDVIKAHSLLDEAIKGGTLTHFAQEPLDESIGSAGKRAIGARGGWGFEPVGEGDVTPAEAVVLAHLGVMTSKRKPGRRAKVVVLS